MSGLWVIQADLCPVDRWPYRCELGGREIGWRCRLGDHRQRGWRCTRGISWVKWPNYTQSISPSVCDRSAGQMHTHGCWEPIHIGWYLKMVGGHLKKSFKKRGHCKLNKQVQEGSWPLAIELDIPTQDKHRTQAPWEAVFFPSHYEKNVHRLGPKVNGSPTLQSSLA